MSFALDPTLAGVRGCGDPRRGDAFGVLPAWQMTALDPGHAQGQQPRRHRLPAPAAFGTMARRAAAGAVAAAAGRRRSAGADRLQPAAGRPRLSSGATAPGARRAWRARTGCHSPRSRPSRSARAVSNEFPASRRRAFPSSASSAAVISSAFIEVEGGTPADRQREYALDRVGTAYFTTLGIPIRRGRDISETDRADSQRVCIVNDAFVQRLFSGRNPIGLHVITVDDNEVRTSYEVVGVAGNARTQALRGDVEPRFFVPAEQRPSFGTTRTFLIRPAANTTAVLPGCARGSRPARTRPWRSRQVASIEEQMAPFTADERNIAQLGVVFGIVALVLAAIGLYGVLSYGVARRAGEIAIRIALGAQSRHVIAMILRENAWLVAAGLAIGGVLALWGSRLIETRLYGVAPHDPLTLTIATAVLYSSRSARRICRRAARREWIRSPRCTRGNASAFDIAHESMRLPGKFDPRLRVGTDRYPFLHQPSVSRIEVFPISCCARAHRHVPSGASPQTCPSRAWRRSCRSL